MIRMLLALPPSPLGGAQVSVNYNSHVGTVTDTCTNSYNRTSLSVGLLL